MEGGRNNVRHHLVVEKHFSQRLAPRFESEATLTLKEVADRVQLPADLTAKLLKNQPRETQMASQAPALSRLVR